MCGGEPAGKKCPGEAERSRDHLVREILRLLFLSIAPEEHEATGHICEASGVRLASQCPASRFQEWPLPWGHSGSEWDCRQRDGTWR